MNKDISNEIRYAWVNKEESAKLSHDLMQFSIAKIICLWKNDFSQINKHIASLCILISIMASSLINPHTVYGDLKTTEMKCECIVYATPSDCVFIQTKFLLNGKCQSSIRLFNFHFRLLNLVCIN